MLQYLLLKVRSFDSIIKSFYNEKKHETHYFFRGITFVMIILIDKNQNRIRSFEEYFSPHISCQTVLSFNQISALASVKNIEAIIADSTVVDEMEHGWESLLMLKREQTYLILLSDRYDDRALSSLCGNFIYVFPSRTHIHDMEDVLSKIRSSQLDEQRKNVKSMSRLKDHLFSNLLEGYDIPPNMTKMMDFLGLSSPSLKYYLSVVISFSPHSGQDLATDWEAAIKMQNIMNEEISKIAPNRSCLRTPNRIAMVLLMKEPGDPFRYVLEDKLEDIRKRIERELSYRINVGVGLAELTIEGINMSYVQACDALDQGRFFGSSFVCFYCDLYASDTKRFQLTRSERDQLAQYLYNGMLPECDTLLEEQFRMFHALGLATKENILALKIDLCVFFMDLSDKLAIITEKPKFYSALINDLLQADSMPTLEFYAKKYLREISNTSKTSNEKRAGRIVHNVQSAIAEHINEPVNVQTLACILRISPNYLSAIYKSETGIRLTEYITNAKMQEAARLLRETDKNIIEISGLLGYDSSNYFSRLFKKQYGVNPSGYRLLFLKPN